MNSLLSGESKLFLFTFLVLSLLVSFSSAIPVTSTTNSSTKGIPVSSGVVPGEAVNYSVLYVNNSQYWQGWDPQAYNTSFIQPYSRWFYNQTGASVGGGNASFNQSLTDNIYVPYNGAIRNVNLSQRNLTGGYTNFVSFFGQNYSATNWYTLIGNLAQCSDPQTLSCSDYDFGGISACEAVGCTYDEFFETCSGTINACSTTTDPNQCAALGCTFGYTGANFTKSRIYLDSNDMLVIESNVSATTDAGVTNPPRGIIRQHYGAHYSGDAPLWALAMTDSSGGSAKFTVTKAPVYATNDFFFQMFGDGVNPNVFESWLGSSFILSTGSAHPIVFSVNRGEDARFDSSGNLVIASTVTQESATLFNKGKTFLNNSLNVTGNVTIGQNLTVFGTTDTHSLLTANGWGGSNEVIGINASMKYDNNQRDSVVIGRHAYTNYTQTVCIGALCNISNFTGPKNVCIGYNCKILSNSFANPEGLTVCLGADATCAGHKTVGIGAGVSAAAPASIAIGQGASTTASTSISIGFSTVAAGTSIAIGNNARTTSANEIAFGQVTRTAGNGMVAIGNGANASLAGDFAVAANGVSNNGTIQMLWQIATTGQIMATAGVLQHRYANYTLSNQTTVGEYFLRDYRNLKPIWMAEANGSATTLTIKANDLKVNSHTEFSNNTIFNSTTTFNSLINLSVMTLSDCTSGLNGTIARNATGVYGCPSNNATGWSLIF